MKVKEVVAELSKLDQEKEIWVIYDSFIPIKPIPDYRQEGRCEYDEGVVLNEGDYVITAG